MALILASASPRRRELMRLLSPDFTVRVSDAEEKNDPLGDPVETVLFNARAKGEAVFRDADPGDTVIAADTIVRHNGKILGKPGTPDEAKAMLRALSGDTHAVYSGVYIRSGAREVSFCEKTEVEFYPLTDAEIDAYVASGDPFDKAGGYGIQSGGALLVRAIRGDYYNVVGFPVARTARALRELREPRA